MIIYLIYKNNERLFIELKKVIHNILSKLFHEKIVFAHELCVIHFKK